MKKLCQINALRYQTKYLFWNITRLLKVRSTSGIAKYLLDDKPHSSTTYPGKAERRCLILCLKPLCIHICQEGELPEAKTDQTKTHKACHGNQAGALVIKCCFASRIPSSAANRMAYRRMICLGVSVRSVESKITGSPVV